MQIAILLYDRFTALDAIGPYEVLSRLPGAELAFVAGEPGEVRTDNGMLTVVAERSLADMPRPDILLVPGGPGEVSARAGTGVLDWLRTAHETTTWTTSVCTGSLILGAAGLLEGTRATSHWLALETLRSLPLAPEIDLAFVDADKENYRAYYEELLPRLRPNGVLVFDNVLWRGQVIDPSSAGVHSSAPQPHFPAVGLSQ